MKVICAFDGKIEYFHFPINSSFIFNEPRNGFLKIIPDNNGSLAWYFNMDFVIAVAPLQ